MTLAALGPQTTRREALEIIAQAFAASGIAEARREARVTLHLGLEIDAADLLAWPEQTIGERAPRLAGIAMRRTRREPLSRITGRREFYGLDLAIGPDVLDPRPDTEVLVEAVLRQLEQRTMTGRPVRILDLGTGSGAILAALLTQLPAASGLATDMAPGALACAAGNLDRLGCAGRFETALSNWYAGAPGRFDVIVSNPPYIAAGALPGLDPEVRLFDPRTALDGGPDGLDAYRAISGGLAGHLTPGGFGAVEVGAGQAGAVAALFHAAGCRVIDVRRDLAGIERVVMVDC